MESIRDNTEKKMYKAKLHAGEVEVMILAQEIWLSLTIMRQKNSKISWINCHRDFGNSPESKKAGNCAKGRYAVG